MAELKPYRLGCREPNRYCLCEARYFDTVKGAANSTRAKACRHPALLVVQERKDGKWVEVPGVIFPKEPHFAGDDWNPIIPE